MKKTKATMKSFMTFKDRRGKMQLNIRAMINTLGYEQSKRKLRIWGYSKKDISATTEFLFKDVTPNPQIGDPVRDLVGTRKTKLGPIKGADALDKNSDERQYPVMTRRASKLVVSDRSDGASV